MQTTTLVRIRQTTSSLGVDFQSAFVLITANRDASIVVFRFARYGGTLYGCSKAAMRSGFAPAAALAWLPGHWLLTVEAKVELAERQVVCVGAVCTTQPCISRRRGAVLEFTGVGAGSWAGNYCRRYHLARLLQFLTDLLVLPFFGETICKDVSGIFVGCVPVQCECFSTV